MKNNTDVVKSLLNQALVNTPDDFALNDVKIFIRKALGIVEGVESKRSLREQKRVERKQLQISPTQLPSVLDAIENELKNEKMKLEEIKKKRSSVSLSDQDDQNGLEYVMG